MNPSEAAEGLLSKIKLYVGMLPEYQAKGLEIRMSAAGECPRALDYDRLHGRPAPSYNSAMRMMLGDYTHIMFQTLLKEIYGDDFHSDEKEVMFYEDGVTVKGHPDGIISSLDCIVEIKSASLETYKSVLNNGPLPSHIRQGNCYGYVTGKSHILFIYVNRNSGDIAAIVLPVNHEQGLNDLRGLIAASKRTELTERPYHDSSASPCWFCPHKEKCYEGFNEQVSSLKSGNEYKNHHVPELSQLAHTVVLHRKVRLESEKKEESARVEIVDVMMEMQEKHVVIDYESFKLSIELLLSKGKDKKLNATVKELA